MMHKITPITPWSFSCLDGCAVKMEYPLVTFFRGFLNIQLCPRFFNTALECLARTRLCYILIQRVVTVGLELFKVPPENKQLLSQLRKPLIVLSQTVTIMLASANGVRPVVENPLSSVKTKEVLRIFVED